MINLDNYLNPVDIKPESKNENELNINDRMYLLNKKMDENFLVEIYENLIDKKNFIEKTNNININDYVFNDIEFLHDHYLNEEKGVFQKLNKCKTKIGSLLLKKIFLNPIHNVNVLKERQLLFNKISFIKNDLTQMFDEIKFLENDLMWFWNDSSMKHIDLMNDLIYFNYDFIPFFNVNNILNNNEKALLITNIYKIVISPILNILTPLISLILPLIILYYMQRKAQLKIPFTTIFSQYIKTLFSTDSMRMIIKNPTKAALASFVTKGIYLFMYFQNVYYSLQSSSNTNKIINIIHDKLNKIKKYIDITNKIQNICNNNGLSNINSFINYISISDDLLIYDEYFNFPIFDKTPQLFTNKGKILYTYQKFKQIKDPIVNVFHYTGVIDMILSIENILSSSTIENPYTITTFLNKNIPTINIKNIWHPYLNKDEVNNIVKNTINIKNNVLITGPNAAGKSTFIKSVIINILLSQTIGISSSEKFEITPFYMIETYLHIPDTKGCSSLFEAEMFRSKEYIEKIKNLDPTKFSFIVLDEIFSSTNYIEGFSGAYSILKKISSFSNTLSITTTHYTDLEILEKDTKGKIQNYKFEVDHDINNEIIFNYILKKGTSRQYIALELLKKNGFDDDVIENALDICKKIKGNKLIFFNNSKIKKIKKKTNAIVSDILL
jgi:energy-coupling factor transporter ATP-binding protein EcfA2